MNKPDLSKDPELVECAKVMMDAYLGHRNTQWDDMSREIQNQWLQEADAARTFFGSGYRLPATEPAPKPATCPATNGDNPCQFLAGHDGPHVQGHLEWVDEPEESHVSLDFASQSAERERRRLLEAFMHDMVSNPAVMAKMLENYEDDEDAIAARLHEIALAFAQELIG